MIIAYIYLITSYNHPVLFKGHQLPARSSQLRLPADGMDLRHPLQQQRRKQVVKLPGREASALVEKVALGWRWDTWKMQWNTLN